MSVIIGLVILGLLIYVAMFLAQFFIMVVGMLIAVPIMGAKWLFDKIRGENE